MFNILFNTNDIKYVTRLGALSRTTFHTNPHRIKMGRKKHVCEVCHIDIIKHKVSFAYYGIRMIWHEISKLDYCKKIYLCVPCFELLLKLKGEDVKNVGK